MTAIGWQGRLNEASTPDAVGLVCRDFLDAWEPGLLAELPDSCQPSPHLQPQEISPYAMRLIRQLGMSERESAPALHEITTFFTKAALRLAQISTQFAAVAAEQRSRTSD